MKIAILTEGTPADTGGIMSFICEEARQFKKRENEGVKCDVYIVRIRPSFLLRVFLSLFKKYSFKTLQLNKKESMCVVQGVVFNNIWINENLLSFAIRTRLTHKPYIYRNGLRICHFLRGYDYLITHKPQGHYIGHLLWNLNHIPFGAFWHGSELGINAFLTTRTRSQAKEIIETAHDNFFVSQSLLDLSDSITKEGRKKVIYTGPADSFFCYNNQDKQRLRKQFGISDGTIVVAYAGHLVDIKNVLLLPQVFKRINEKCNDKNLVFWILGHGELERELSVSLDNTNISYTMFGNIQPEDMPDYMNCIDILVLISKKEGLGLVCLEAKKCGALVFGSCVGGIPEAIGRSNCVELNDDFVENFSDLISESIVNGKGSIEYDEKFSWRNAIDSILQCISE